MYDDENAAQNCWLHFVANLDSGVVQNGIFCSKLVSVQLWSWINLLHRRFVEFCWLWTTRNWLVVSSRMKLIFSKIVNKKNLLVSAHDPLDSFELTKLNCWVLSVLSLNYLVSKHKVLSFWECKCEFLHCEWRWLQKRDHWLFMRKKGWSNMSDSMNHSIESIKSWYTCYISILI